MSTFDQVIIDDRDLVNRYFGDTSLDDDQYRLSDFSIDNRRPLGTRFNATTDFLTNPSDNSGLLGRRVFLESPSFGNKDEEDIYRFVPSRLSDNPAALPAHTAETLIDSLDFELNILGASDAPRPLAYRTNPQLLTGSKPPVPLTQISNPSVQPFGGNFNGADPRQDPLLGPLLAELDAISTQQRPKQQQENQALLPPPSSLFRRNSAPYEPSIIRPIPSHSQSNQAFTNNVNRTVTDALLETQLFDSLETRDTQIPPLQSRQSLPSSAPNLNSNNQTRPQENPTLAPRTSNMNSTDIFLPSSYDTGPGSFLSNFGPDNQLFQQPLLNSLGQNYVPNNRSQPPQQQTKQNFDARGTSFDNSFSRVPPPPPQRNPYSSDYGNDDYQRQPPPSLPQQQRNPYAPTRPNNDYQRQAPPSPPPPLNNRQVAYDNMDPFTEYHDMYAPSNSRNPPSQSQRQGAQTNNSQQQSYQRSGPQQPYYDASKQSTNRELFFTDHEDDQFDQFSGRPNQLPPPGGNSVQRNGEHQEQDSRRQAIWDELQRNNAKVQEKNAKKRESVNRREQLLKGNYAGTQQSSAPTKLIGNPPPVQRRPPPLPVAKTNYIDENIDMIKNKENFYHRYPAKKYENLYSKRKDLANGGPGQIKRQNDKDQDMTSDFDQTNSSGFNNGNDTGDNNSVSSKHRGSLPVTINLNAGQTTKTGPLPATVTIPLGNSHVNRVGDKISVNIDLSLVDLQNLRQQQAAEHPDWTGLDPLDRHIRKLERSIDQSLPQTDSPTRRSPTFPQPTIGTSIGRYGKLTTGAGGGSGGYMPPSYGGDHYSYSEKGQNEDSYLAKMNNTKRGPTFKPYTGTDYEQFKKNHGTVGGFLGFDFDNPNYKEKSDKLLKTKEYAQLVEARNKKKLADAPRRTLSDTRVPPDTSKTQKALDYARVSTRHKQSSGTTTRSTPPEMNGSKGTSDAGRRPTEVVNRPPVPPKTNKSPPNDNDLIDRLAMRHEREKAQVQGILNPSQKRREPLFEEDQGINDIERLAQDRAQQRRISPPKPLPPAGPNVNSSGRRPLRFDNSGGPDDSNNGFVPAAPSSNTQFQPQPYSQPYAPQRAGPSSPPARTPPRRVPDRSSHRQQPPPEDDVDELANRHNDEKMLMEAIRQELSERPLGDDEELIVIQQ